MPTTELDPWQLKRSHSSRRKRFLAISGAALAVLAVILGISFLGSTGSTSVAISGSSSNFVYPVANGATVPTPVTSLEYTSGISGGTIGTAVLPSWSPTANSAGSVTTAGDLAVVDATSASNGVTVSMYLTNLAGLQQDYSSFAFPLNVYSASCSSGCSWSQASNVISSPPTYVTSTEGYLSFRLPAGKYYDIVMNTGGSYYSTATTSGDLSPSFYFSAQPY